MRPFILAPYVFAAAVAASTAGAQGAHDEPGRYVEVAGSRLYVESFGSGAPLLFLHGGILFFDNSFAAQRDYFRSYRRVIGYDRRGHGHSPDDGRPFSYDEEAEVAAALIRALGTGPVDVVGHSDGGNIGLILAKQHPELVRRLVVSGANLSSSLSPEEYESHRTWSPERLAAQARKVSDRLPSDFRRDYEGVAPESSRDWFGFDAKSYLLWSTPVVLTPADLKTITAPVLVMSGDHDFTPLEESISMFRTLPRGQLVVLPGTGHGTFQQHPEETNYILRDFLDAPTTP